ncbi:MAG TPA: hypothetical protein VE291_13220 [Terracidiphilus sp.]|jgi:hypothetical protein|nr:hypothetical protein [Terracidiphilus sp.]
MGMEVTLQVQVMVLWGRMVDVVFHGVPEMGVGGVMRLGMLDPGMGGEGGHGKRQTNQKSNGDELVHGETLARGQAEAVEGRGYEGFNEARGERLPVETGSRWQPVEPPWRWS